MLTFGPLFFVDPLLYFSMKEAARWRHEFPVTPMGFWLKFMFGLHADDDLIRLIYPI